MPAAVWPRSVAGRAGLAMLLLGVTALAQVDPDAVNSTASRSVATLTVAGGLPEDAAALLQLAEDDIDAAFREWQNAVATEASLPFNGSGYVASDRQRIFQDNFNYIQRRKQEDPDLGLSLNEFAALTLSEFQDLLGAATQGEGGFLNAQPRNLPSSYRYKDTVPFSYIDWAAQGMVTPVKSQGQCGSCWAFSGVAMIESAFMIQKGLPAMDLAEQDLVDCAPRSHSGKGNCGGNGEGNALDYAVSQGIRVDSQNPYTASDPGYCPTSDTSQKRWTLASYEDTPTSSELFGGGLYASEINLMKTLSHQPAVIYLEAGTDFQLYSHGVLGDTDKGATCSYTEINHAVTAVGYAVNTKAQPDGTIVGAPGGYLIIKNSWGSGFGGGWRPGYAKIVFGGHGADGCMGITAYGSFFGQAGKVGDPDQAASPPPPPPPSPPPPGQPDPSLAIPCYCQPDVRKNAKHVDCFLFVVDSTSTQCQPPLQYTCSKQRSVDYELAFNVKAGPFWLCGPK